MKTIALDTAAAKQLDALPADAREAITEALAMYAIAQIGNTKVLKGKFTQTRLRVGAYRVFFVEGEDLIEVTYIGRRTSTTYK